MAQGSWTATGASSLLIAADIHRSELTIQKTNATIVALGIGVAAEAGKGVQLVNINDTIILTGIKATKAIYMIGNGGTGAYESGPGNIKFIAGPKVT